MIKENIVWLVKIANMLTKHEEFILNVFVVLLGYMGNDPRIFSLYFTCKTLYGKYMLRRSQRNEGPEKFLNLGCVWDIALSSLQRVKVKNILRKLFDGYIVCDMVSLYAIFNLPDGRYFRIPSPCVQYFYLVKCENGDIILKKFSFYRKLNIVSANDSNTFENSKRILCKMFMCVGDNYKVYKDSFILGCRFELKRLMLTSNFCLGETNFMGITCFSSFRDWVHTIEGLNYELIKRYFCYAAFRNQVMAMFQCVKCC